MTDIEIKNAIDNEELIIKNFDDKLLKPIAYSARLGKKALIGGHENEINLEEKGFITLKAGDFILFNTEEKFTLNNDIAGRIGIRSYYARKGLILLAGMHIDPSWDGYLIIGGYNASPGDITLDYKSDIIAIEFHKLNQPPKKQAKNNPEQTDGRLPIIDKEFIRRMETESLSSLSLEVRNLVRSMDKMDDEVKDLSSSVKSLNENIKEVNKNVTNKLMLGFGFISILAIFLQIS